MATIEEKKEKEKTYNINHFEEVGWIDPHCKERSISMGVPQAM